ncbi:MAG TPA: squalene--hopene cyclase [Acidiphilium sp.]|nr:MAG: squalene--hopene cyclase [Acidiphilium sp. 21-60-14]OYV92317.1 MAG: squalene--hopene cyclase [Acidiphilium sp. 37-60-79]OZB38801.1 MAG: squalene--hopene cyclase [Acidiphilium sp. 34-60-192]HQT88638.1 squalene--hopene cyclase [Acidiphilium sp.]HQU23659.1 squalene--hopene cyclase [Acidiphilium sp.]
MLDSISLDHADLDTVIAAASARLRAEQRDNGHYVYELEADATIPAEYVLLEHFLDRIDPALQAKLGVYLRAIQGDSPQNPGGWPLFHDGAMDLSASVKAYFALKALGDDPQAPHMQRARAAILARGGAARTNVFTRIQLALFGAAPWHACPMMPVEIMLLPGWFPVSMDKISYWSRTVIAPLLVLMSKRPVAANPRQIRIDELFVTPPDQVRDYIRGPYKSAWGSVFKAIDVVLRPADRLFPARTRARAIQAALDFITPRLNGDDGLGGIYPAMANTVMMYHTLGYAPDHPDYQTAWQSVRKLITDASARIEGGIYVQPCLSPVWDTGLAAHALAEAEGDQSPAVAAACNWLIPRQILDVKGDWAIRKPHAPPGGWAFQYNNAYYPDVDDTAVVGMILHRTGDPAHEAAIERARLWILGMQSRSGGWGAFDSDNEFHYLNHIPFADHGALLDPPTEDVTARCVAFLAQLGHPQDRPAIERGVAFLRETQKPDGSWFGRWGTNYIYGTWSCLCALHAAGVDHGDHMIVRAVHWLLNRQREDGGWGEDCESYAYAEPGRYHESLPSQTAWALLGLMAVGETDHPAVARGMAYLQASQGEDGSWREQAYNAVGFPRVFYLRYHGYPRFFPLLALARFRNLTRSNDRIVPYGF